MLFELGGVAHDAARECFARVAYKLPIRVRLIGRKTKKKIHLGDPISVLVVRVDREAGRIDLVPDWGKPKNEENWYKKRRRK